MIRAALSEKVRAVVLGEVAKDLTKLPNPQIRTHLGDELPHLSELQRLRSRYCRHLIKIMGLAVREPLNNATAICLNVPARRRRTDVNVFASRICRAMLAPVRGTGDAMHGIRTRCDICQVRRRGHLLGSGRGSARAAPADLAAQGVASP